ncbi:hypothetical protein ACMA46_00665 [Clavibacter sp. Sh2141]|uniref:hypothetical protein n=1 Tax=Clavibacter sp. Sh2141 TaxID=3395374 RepID=UPI0039BC4698
MNKYQKARLLHVTAEGPQWIDVMPGDIVDRPATGHLKCFKCEVRMTWVQPSVNRRGTEIPSHLRLSRGVRHDDGCPIDFKTVMDGLRASREHAVELRNRQFFLRLPDESIERAIQRTASSIQRRTNAPSWATTFGTATRIARLVGELTDDSSAVNEIKVEYRDANGDVDVLFWADFCFRADQARPLLRYYAKVRDAPSVTRIHPVAIRMTLAADPQMTHNGLKQRISVLPGLRVDRAGRSHGLVVSAYSEGQFRGLRRGDELLILARADRWHRGYDDREELRLDVVHAWQIARL